MTHDSHPRPSGDAARIALIACAVAALGMLLFPLATLGRGFSADAVLMHVTGSVMNLTSNQQAPLPPTGTVLALAWAALAALLVTLAGAWGRQRWFWVTGLLTFGLATAAVVVLGGALDDQTRRVLADTTLRPGAKRQLGNFYASGGMNLGLFLPALAGLIAAGAGLSATPRVWQAFNRMRSLLVPAAAIGLAVLVGAVVVLIVQPSVNQSGAPMSLWGAWLAKSDLVYFVYSTLFAPVTALNPLLDSLKLATPLIFTGLSVAFAFRTGLFNIGAPGQLTMGAIAAMLVGVYGPPSLGYGLLALSVLAAAAGGALWGAIPGLLKARFGSSEVINTIMLNYIASSVLVFLIGSDSFPFLGREYPQPLKAEGSNPQSELLNGEAQLRPLLEVLNVGQNGQVALSIGLLVALAAFVIVRLLARKNRTLIALAAAAVLGALTWRIGIPVSVTGSQLNGAFLIALLCAAGFGMLMWRTAAGYALRAVGLSPKAAEYGGISVAKNTILAMTIAGMFAGLAGTHYVNGGALDEYRLKQNMPVNVGFDGIAVALMGQSTPVGVVASSVLFGTIDTGAVSVTTKLSKVNSDIVTVLKALIVLFIAAGGFLSRRLTSPPPPALAAAADRHETPAAADVTKTLTPQPNVAQASEDITREGNK
ncbi:ABC transporter permease [Deinococcus soli (ex Cha et al. 2016)]|uniref:Simple sugar transport system permease protein n=2 Tax=Deinococcus soli (ex Cha et al. 2016) TaxID=1309411 RepID=A0ACC6KCL1_9DEIO|nr:simple sugar transport system permease protein [Deinococcus soli (ex Cha et al. 2016)]MDR6327917.1 simple sugar transport system permease protein [Deinococcus soli (ex Cha et al. 2016)]MDR6750192.1 simple sugar transport system permease protein [Deinococcus soli (ex Cha et al. 2016)]